MCIVFLLKFNGSVNTQDRTLETMWITYASMCVSCLQKNVSRSNFAGFLSRFDVKLLRHTLEVCETSISILRGRVRGHVSLHVGSLFNSLHKEKQPAMTPQHRFSTHFFVAWVPYRGRFKRNPTWEQVMSEVDVTFRYLHMNMIFGVAQESYLNYIIQYNV